MSSATEPLGIAGYQVRKWSVDPSRSKIELAIRQLFSEVRGQFTDFEVIIETGEELIASSVTATINLASIETGNQRRDKHLLGPELLRADENATASYRSTGLQVDAGAIIIKGLLTVHGIRQFVTVALEAIEFDTDPCGAVHARFVAAAEVSRRAFGIGIRMDPGGAVISDKISIRAEISAALRD